MEQKPLLEMLSIRAQPFSIAFAIVGLFAGTVHLFYVEPYGALVRLLGQFTWVWCVGVIIGCTVTLSALFIKTIDTLLIERIGLCVMFTFFASYDWSGIVLLGTLDFTGAYYALTFSIGSIIRIVQITRHIHLIKQLGANNGG